MIGTTEEDKIMGYEIFFWLAIGFVLGRLSKNKFYIGPNKKKYEQADWAILTK